MPIYEFLCEECRTVFSFHSSGVDTSTVPCCPKCSNTAMKKQFSVFSTNRKAEQYDETKVLEGFDRLIDGVEEEKAENIAGRLLDFAETSGIKFNTQTENDLAEYMAGDKTELLKTKFDSQIELDSSSFSKGEVFVQKEGRSYLLDEKLYDLHQK